MSEQEYVDSICKLWPPVGGRPSPRLWKLVKEGLQTFPHSHILWCLHGDLYQLTYEDNSSAYDPHVALESYKRAASIEPRFAEAHNEIGYILDVYFDRFAEAEAAFRKAIALDSDYSAYCGLARVLAEMERTDEAAMVLSPDRCPFSGHPEIEAMRQEIASGLWGRGKGSGGEERGQES